MAVSVAALITSRAMATAATAAGQVMAEAAVTAAVRTARQATVAAIRRVGIRLAATLAVAVTVAADTASRWCKEC
jgi:hypothetical protein